MMNNNDLKIISKEKMKQAKKKKVLKPKISISPRTCLNESIRF